MDQKNCPLIIAVMCGCGVPIRMPHWTSHSWTPKSHNPKHHAPGLLPSALISTLLSPYFSSATFLSDLVIDFKRLKDDDHPAPVKLRDRLEEARLLGLHLKRLFITVLSNRKRREQIGCCTTIVSMAAMDIVDKCMWNDRVVICVRMTIN